MSTCVDENGLRMACLLKLQKVNATGRMQHMKTNNRKSAARLLVYTISEASRIFATDRVKLHRWVKVGVLRKCNEDGTYSKSGRFILGRDLEKLLSDPNRKSGKPLKPAAKKNLRLTKWQRLKVDPEWSPKRRASGSAALLETIHYILKIDSSDKAVDILEALSPALSHLKRLADGAKIYDGEQYAHAVTLMVAQYLERQERDPLKLQKKQPSRKRSSA